MHGGKEGPGRLLPGKDRKRGGIDAVAGGVHSAQARGHVERVHRPVVPHRDGTRNGGRDVQQTDLTEERIVMDEFNGGIGVHAASGRVYIGSRTETKLVIDGSGASCSARIPSISRPRSSAFFSRMNRV